MAVDLKIPFYYLPGLWLPKSGSTHLFSEVTLNPLWAGSATDNSLDGEAVAPTSPNAQGGDPSLARQVRCLGINI